MRAAEIVTGIDADARRLLANHHGQEIDKTDGFLMIFERPLDAVQFALDLHIAMRAQSESHNVSLAYRVGIHVGEVVMWKNKAEDVARGAKPVEIEGLAKPMAARIMSLGGGGQTLLTRGAWDLARRAAVGQDAGLQFSTHGLYTLKGVAEPIEVCEVCPAGAVPVAPRGSKKARGYRRVPRAPLLAGAVLIAVGILLGVWGVPFWSDRDEVIEGRRWVELPDGGRVPLFGRLEHPTDYRNERRARVIRSGGRVHEIRFETEAGFPDPVATLQKGSELVSGLGVTEPLVIQPQVSAVRFRYQEDGETLDRLEYTTRDDVVVLVDEIIQEPDGWRSHTWRTPDGTLSSVPWYDSRRTHRARTQVDDRGRLVRMEPMLEDVRHPEVAALVYERDDQGRVVRVTAVDTNNNPRMMRRRSRASPVAIRYAYGDPNHPDVPTREDALGFGDVPLSALHGCATFTHELDAVGRPVRSACLDVDGKPVRSYGSPDGCFGWEWRPLPSGHLHICLGEDGEPAPSARVWTMLEHALDDRGYKSDQRYRDAAGDLTHGTGEIAERHYERDDYGYLLGEGPYLQKDGKPHLYGGKTWGERRQFNDDGLVLQRTEVGVDRAPVNDARGVAITQWERDRRGRLIGLKTFDESSRPVSVDGVHAQVQSFGDQAWPDDVALEDAMGKPIADEFGRARTRLTYYADGVERSRAFFDLEGEPMLAPNKGAVGSKPIWCHRIEAEKDGWTLIQRCLDTGGSPMMNSEDWAIIAFQNSAFGDSRDIRKMDATGELIDGPGHAHLHVDLDSSGRRVRRTATARDGSPATELNCHIFETDRDSQGAPTETRCLGKDGLPKRARAWGGRRTRGDSGGIGMGLGCATERVRYQAGAAIPLETRCFGVHGQPILDRFGVHHTRRTLNDRGWRIGMVHFGVEGEPVLDEDGSHRYEYDRDDRGRAVDIRLFGVDGEPLPARARVTSEYNGGETIRTDYDSGDNVRRVLRTLRDHRGRVTFESDLDGNGSTRRRDGCHAIQYGLLGDEIVRTECVDASGKITANTRGVAVTVRDFGGEVEVLTYLDADGQPTLRHDRYHRVQTTFDRRDRKIELRWFGLEGQPTLNEHGHARHTTAWDRYDNKIEEAWYDVDNDPVKGPNGCTRVLRTVDAAGQISGESCADHPSQ